MLEPYTAGTVTDWRALVPAMHHARANAPTIFLEVVGTQPSEVDEVPRWARVVVDADLVRGIRQLVGLVEDNGLDTASLLGAPGEWGPINGYRTKIGVSRLVAERFGTEIVLYFQASNVTNNGAVEFETTRLSPADLFLPLAAGNWLFGEDLDRLCADVEHEYGSRVALA